MKDLSLIADIVREKAPRVQCITNFVTVNDCANILLACGASPAMMRDTREAADCMNGAGALVCNLGAVEDVDAMIIAGKTANEMGLPVVLDPVAAGATNLRKAETARLLENVSFSVIRGNASEIRSIAMNSQSGSGVDVSEGDLVGDHNLAESIDLISRLASSLHTVIALSGPIDLVSDGTQAMAIRNGCPMMARITGSGCMLTTLIGAFCAVCPDDPFSAACAAIGLMGICGEKADERRKIYHTGNATFRNDLIDAVFDSTGRDILEGIQYEIYTR